MGWLFNQVSLLLLLLLFLLLLLSHPLQTSGEYELLNTRVRGPIDRQCITTYLFHVRGMVGIVIYVVVGGSRLSAFIYLN